MLTGELRAIGNKISAHSSVGRATDFEIRVHNGKPLM